MTEPTDRVEEFRKDIAAMRLKDPALVRESLLLRAGVVAMLAGAALAVICIFISNSANNVLNQNDAIVAAIAGVAIAVVGAATWLRYSLASFLRFWLARLIFEQRSQTDRIVAEGK